MTRLKLPALLLGATALTLAPAAAQQQQQQQESGLQGACEQLYQLVRQSEQAGEDLLEEFRMAPQVAEQNEAEACVLMIERVETAGGMTTGAQERGEGAKVMTESEGFRATDTVKETVTIEQQAVVQGEVLVRQPIPEIAIEEGGAEVQVRERPADVEIDEQPAQVLVKQAPARIRVSVPRPTITFEQQAPEIIITMPAPGVNIDQEQPEVNVVVAEPKVTVSQEEPQVEVDVDARLVSADDPAASQGGQPQVATRTERTTASGESAGGKEFDVTLRKAKPSIRFVAAESEANVRYNRANPEVVFEPAEPDVEVTFADEPRIEVRQVGEPTVRLRRRGEEGQQASAEQPQQGQQQGEQQQLAAQQPQAGQQESAQQGQQQPQQQQSQQMQEQSEQQQAQQQSEEQAQQGEGSFTETVAAVEGRAGEDREREKLSAEETSRILGVQEGTEIAAEGELIELTVGDLDGRDVITMSGEEVGEIEGIFQSGGQIYAVIEHGGFLGIGDSEVAIPADRLALRGDEVLLLGLTEEQLDRLPEYDFEADEEVAAEQPIRIGRIQ